MFCHRFTTPGEILCGYLFKQFSGNLWTKLEEVDLRLTGSARGYRHYIQEALAINLTGRIILKAEYIKTQAEPNDSSFLPYLNSALQDMQMWDINRNGQLARIARDALIAKNHAIPDTLRKKMREKCIRRNSTCYLCGNYLNYESNPSAASDDNWTLDHVWPQCFGGDSIEDNLLPACHKCNSKKKRNFPSWAGINVHFVMCHQNATLEERRTLTVSEKFALHNLTVAQLASEKSLSLKDAYQRTGPHGSVPELIDKQDVGHFFNLSI